MSENAPAELNDDYTKFGDYAYFARFLATLPTIEVVDLRNGSFSINNTNPLLVNLTEDLLDLLAESNIEYHDDGASKFIVKPDPNKMIGVGGDILLPELFRQATTKESKKANFLRNLLEGEKKNDLGIRPRPHPNTVRGGSEPGSGGLPSH